jgi:hypothetical protein
MWVVERAVAAAYRFGQVAHGVRYRGRHVVAKVQRVEQPASQRLDAGNRRVDLARGARVAREPCARGAIEGRQAQRLASGGDGVVQGVGIDGASPRERAFGKIAVAALERSGEVLEDACDFGQQRRRAAQPRRGSPAAAR